MKTKARVIAFYLPQFHPVPENDEMWGKGFTEWTNVAKAKPLFKGHYQPQIPADLGFYDLRLPEIREEQAKMAEEYGVEGFCYWHYWFGNGKMVLQSVLEEVLKSGEPDFPFCVGWANHSWSNKTWEKTGRFKTTVVFLNQTYPGNEDYINHFMYLLPFFKDPRYITVDGKPLFMIFNPYEIPDNKHLIELWNQLAVQNGLPGIYFVARCESATPKFSREEVIKGVETRKRFDYWIEQGYDAIYSVPVEALKIICQGDRRYRFENLTKRFHINTAVEKYDYRKMLPYTYGNEDYREDVFPQIMPHWDNTPRQGKNGYVYINESPENFGKQIDLALQHVQNKQFDHKIIFAHSWNEWGEGAYLEPDMKYGLHYLDQIAKKVLY